MVTQVAVDGHPARSAKRRTGPAHAAATSDAAAGRSRRRRAPGSIAIETAHANGLRVTISETRHHAGKRFGVIEVTITYGQDQPAPPIDAIRIVRPNHRRTSKLGFRPTDAEEPPLE